MTGTSLVTRGMICDASPGMALATRGMICFEELLQFANLVGSVELIGEIRGAIAMIGQLVGSAAVAAQLAAEIEIRSQIIGTIMIAGALAATIEEVEHGESDLTATILLIGQMVGRVTVSGYSATVEAGVGALTGSVAVVGALTGSVAVIDEATAEVED